MAIAGKPSSLKPLPVFLWVLALLYATLAGLHTVVDFDLGWQMAGARTPWSAVDTLSYTASGTPWIYPPLAGMILRALFAAGGYVAISWLCAAALALTVAIIAVGSRPAVSLLVILALPALERQMIPRSGLFTVLLAAVTVRLLLDLKAGRGRPRPYLLPLVMVAWVNLHPGFIAGLALIAGYLASEALDLARPGEAAAARARLRRALPWALAALPATLINPWGARMWSVVAAQEHPTALESSVIRELAPLYRELRAASLNPLDPLNAIWALLLLCAVALVLLLLARRWGLALLLGVGMAACLLSGRSQGVFIPLGCLVAGEAFPEASLLAGARRIVRRPPLAWALTAALVAMVGVRSLDIVTDRVAVREDRITTFGAGPSWWIPRRAVDFIAANRLPGELFSSFNLGSYVAGRLAPAYRDFADGRYLPFRGGIAAEQLRLTALPLDSREWKAAAARWKIRSVILPLSRFYGIAGVPLREDCESRGWTPVFLDTTAIVLVSNDAVEPARLASMRIDCQRAPLISVPAKSGVGRYEEDANAAVILFVLGRSGEAQAMLDRAGSRSREDDSLLLLEGELEAARNDPAGAEASFRRSLALHQTDSAWYQLGRVEAGQGDYPGAIRALRRALELEIEPSFAVESSLAQAEILGGAGEEALRTLDRASRELGDVPDGDRDRALAEIDDLRGAALAGQSRWAEAIDAERQALRLTPAEARRWQALAAIYAAAGDAGRAAWAHERAASLAVAP